MFIVSQKIIIKSQEIEMQTLLKDEVSKINKITDTALEEEFVSHQKPKLQDAPIDQRTKLELEQLLIRNSDCFAEDEHQLGTTPLITMSIDTGIILLLQKGLTLLH